MKKNRSYEVFLETLQERYTEKKTLANRLVELLNIQKEAVYRRLRGIVPFTFEEITTIAMHLDISLDNIMAHGINNSKTRPLRLTLANYLQPEKEDYFLLDTFVDDMKGFSSYPNSEFISITNTIPQLLYIKYESIYRFYLFKWQYEEGNVYVKTLYKDILLPEKMKVINKEYLKQTMEAQQIVMIWDKNTLRMLEEDVRYFYDIRLISKEEVIAIREDMNSLINELEQITIAGEFYNGKKVQFYISHISIKGSYNIMAFNPHYKLSMIKWFTINDTIATDEYTYQKTKNWMAALQRSSTLISESGEIQRIRFLDEQREIVSLLEDL